jgi:integrase
VGVYKRGSIWWASYAGPGGRLVRESTGERDRRLAERIERQRRASVAAGTWSPIAASGVTIASWAETWIARQHERGLRTSDDIETRARLHVLPALGKWPLADLRPRDVRRFVEGLRAGDLSPRSQHHVYDVLRGMMRDAVIEELIPASPCVLAPGTLPKKRDADPDWRTGAVLTRAELETLISDERIPEDRRTYYALIALGGMRHGEASARRWRDYDATTEPLGRLTVATQIGDDRASVRALKTETPRAVPVHPTLAAILAEWRLGGFGRMLGRSPREDDWIVPSRRGKARAVRHTLSKLHEDLDRVGLRARRTHDLRRTLITLARADGAPRDALQAVTHGPRGDVLDQYTSWPWPTLCAAVSCLRVERRRGEVYNLVHMDGPERRKPPVSQGLPLRSGRDSKP